MRYMVGIALSVMLVCGCSGYKGQPCGASKLVGTYSSSDGDTLQFNPDCSGYLDSCQARFTYQPDQSTQGILNLSVSSNGGGEYCQLLSAGYNVLDFSLSGNEIDIFEGSGNEDPSGGIFTFFRN